MRDIWTRPSINLLSPAAHAQAGLGDLSDNLTNNASVTGS